MYDAASLACEFAGKLRMAHCRTHWNEQTIRAKRRGIWIEGYDAARSLHQELHTQTIRVTRKS